MNLQNSNYSNLWWAINGVLAGMGIPYISPERRYNSGGDLEAYADELPILYSMGIRAVVCLLNIPSDAAVFQSAGFEFKCLPVNDGQPPTSDQVGEFLDFTSKCRLRNLPVVVFCEAGLGRTGTMIASYIIHNGESAVEAIARVRSVEPSAVETIHQIKFLEEFALRLKQNG